MIAHLQVIGVGRGVDGAEGAVDVEGMDEGASREALGVDALHDVAGQDVVDDALDVGLVGVALHVGDDDARGLRAGPVRGWLRGGGLESGDQLVDLDLGAPVGGFDVPVEADVSDHLDNVLEVVEDEERVHELEERVGEAQHIALGGRHPRFEVADDLVAEVTHRAAVEGGQVGVGDQPEALELRLQRQEWVGGAGAPLRRGAPRKARCR